MGKFGQCCDQKLYLISTIQYSRVQYRIMNTEAWEIVVSQPLISDMNQYKGNIHSEC